MHLKYFDYKCFTNIIFKKKQQNLEFNLFNIDKQNDTNPSYATGLYVLWFNVSYCDRMQQHVFAEAQPQQIKGSHCCFVCYSLFLSSVYQQIVIVRIRSGIFVVEMNSGKYIFEKKVHTKCETNA